MEDGDIDVGGEYEGVVPTADRTGVAGVHGELRGDDGGGGVRAGTRGDDGGEYGTVTVRGGLLADDVGVLEDMEGVAGTATFGARLEFELVSVQILVEVENERSLAVARGREAAPETSATMRAVRWKPLPMSSNDMEVTAARSVDAEPKSDFSGTPKCAAARAPGAPSGRGLRRIGRACAVGGKRASREHTRAPRARGRDAWRAHTCGGFRSDDGLVNRCQPGAGATHTWQADE